MVTAKEIMFGIMMGMSDYNIHDVAIHPEQLYCMSINVYHESRGESLAGKSAVAHVTLNRVRSKLYPNNICDVVKDAKMRPSWRNHSNMVPIRNQCQFSWYCDGRSDAIELYLEGHEIRDNMTAWNQSVQASMLAIMGLTIDPTDGSTHYFNHNLVNPDWSQIFKKKAVLGNHSFYQRTK